MKIIFDVRGPHERQEFIPNRVSEPVVAGLVDSVKLLNQVDNLRSGFKVFAVAAIAILGTVVLDTALVNKSLEIIKAGELFTNGLPVLGTAFLGLVELGVGAAFVKAAFGK